MSVLYHNCVSLWDVLIVCGCHFMKLIMLSSLVMYFYPRLCLCSFAFVCNFVLFFSKTCTICLSLFIVHFLWMTRLLVRRLISLVFMIGGHIQRCCSINGQLHWRDQRSRFWSWLPKHWRWTWYRLLSCWSHSSYS